MDSRITKLLRHHHVLTLATTSPDGPWTAHCFYAFMPEHDAIVFTSDPATRHGSNMLANPRVSAGISLETKLIGKIRGIQLTGTARYCAPPLPPLPSGAPPLPRPQGARERGPGGEVIATQGARERGPGGEVVALVERGPGGEVVATQGARERGPGGEVIALVEGPSGPGGEVVALVESGPGGEVVALVEREPGGEAARTAYLLRFPFALAAKLDLWILEIDYVKMTDNRLGFGKKLEWRRGVEE